MLEEAKVKIASTKGHKYFTTKRRRICMKVRRMDLWEVLRVRPATKKFENLIGL